MAKRIGKYKVSKKEDALSLKSDLAGGGHIKSVGTVPTLTVTTAGDGTCTISAESTDVAGTVTFADTWANSDTLLDFKSISNLFLDFKSFSNLCGKQRL